MTAESNIIETWLYTVLSGDATLHALVADRIFNTISLQDEPYPCVIFQWQGGHDVMNVSTYRIMVDALYVVKAVAKSAVFADVKAIADRVDTLLHSQAGDVAGLGTVFMCNREQPFQLVEQDGDTHYRHLGGIYRIIAQSV